MKEYLISEYGISPETLSELEGDINYSNKKFLVTDSSGEKYILKIYGDRDELILAREETRILEQIGDSLAFDVPRTILNKSGEFFTPLKDGDLRLLKFIDGDFLAETDQTDDLLYDFGRSIGELHKILNDIDSPIIKSRKLFWDLQYTHHNYSKSKYIGDPELRKHVDYYFDRFHHKVLPILHRMRHSYIHGDLNDYNVLSEANKIKGFIDFGDACYTPLVNELAIAACYVMFGKPEPFDAFLPLIKGFNDTVPLNREEILILPDLITARLSVSLCNSAQKKSRSEDSTYVLISEEAATELLLKWKEHSPILILNKMLAAIGMTPVNEKIDHESALKARRSISSKSQSLSYSSPIYMESALFQYMYDRQGNAYLDAYNNIPHVGHSHPYLTKAIYDQSSKLNTNTRYIYDSFNEYGQRLLEYFPDHLNKIFFVNSGSAASDLAIRLSKNFTGRDHLLVMDHGYHGNTATGISISPYKFDGKGGKGLPENITKLPLPNTYNSTYSGKDYAAEAAATIRGLIESNIRPAAFISEPISGCGGQIPLAEDYLKSIYPILRKMGIITISDEVQVGFGRLGKWFWGFEMHEIIPDIVILGKPMGNGHPIGAIVTSTEIADSFATGMEFFSSFGGNPVSCEAAGAVLTIIENEELQRNAEAVGNYYLSSLRQLQSLHKIIGDVRGSGLFIGIEFTLENGKPGTSIANKVKNRLKEHFILTGTDGPFDNIIKSKPPLCFNNQNVDRVVNTIDLILRKG